MIHEGKEYKLTEGTGAPCTGCMLSDLCDSIADDMNMVEFELCATEEDYEDYEKTIYGDAKLFADITTEDLSGKDVENED